jgi:hypothetical protein
VVNHYGNDRRQALRFGVLEQEGVPDANDVAKQPKGHEWVVRALVLEQHINECPLAITSNAEKQIRLTAAEALIDEGRRLQLQRIPVEALR